MKISGLIFIIFAALIIIKYKKVSDINNLIIAGVFALWFLTIYIGIHLKNKDRNTPRPVYLAN